MKRLAFLHSAALGAALLTTPAMLGLSLIGCGDTSKASAPSLATSGASGSLASAGSAGAGAAGQAAILGGAGGGAGTEPVVGGAGGTAGTVGGAGGAAGMSGTGSNGGTSGTVELVGWHFFGRWDLRDTKRAITVNGGSHISTTFNGTSITANFDTSGNTGQIPTVAWQVDDGAWSESEIVASLPLGKGLAASTHRLTLFVRGMNESDARWKPPLVASTVFLGFSVSGGSILPTARPGKVKLEFLGDSITEGVRVHSAGPQGQTTNNWLADGRRAYASLVGTALEADYRQVGFGRQGLTVVASGGVPKAQDAFNWTYAGVPRDSWRPDIVVINEGTNDRSSTGAVFAPLYGKYLDLIRAAYPDATLVALEPFVGAFGTEITAQVALRREAGDTRVVYIDTTGWTAPADFSDGLHPNVTGSEKIRDRLVPILQALQPPAN